MTEKRENESQFADPKIHPITAPVFDEAEVENVRRCLNTGWVTQGPMTAEFERRVASVHNVSHALATTSCTAALHLAALALGLGPGDEVIVPAFTWITSANAAEYVGAKAVFADIDLETYNIDPAAFAAAITPATRAVVVVHLFGLAADLDPIMEIARAHSIAVIEDAACAIGTTYNSLPIGGVGDIGCFSFHPRKVVTTGEGGMVTTNDQDLADRVASFRNHGSTGMPPGEREAPQPWSMATFNNLGFNLRLSDIQAAVGNAQMDKLASLLAERRSIANRYLEMLAGTNTFALPTGGDLDGHTFQSFVVRPMKTSRDGRNAIMAALDEQGIKTRPGTHAVHRLGYYADKYGLAHDAFPNASLAEDTTITLPIYPGMTRTDQEIVCNALVNAHRDAAIR